MAYLAVDESINVSGLAQLVLFIRYVANTKLEEELLMYVALPGWSTGEDIISAVDMRLQNDGLLWEQCISTCTDGAGAVAGKN